MLEKDIECRMAQKIKKTGGLCYKFVSPNNPGVPDRIVITPDGRTIYVELKTETGRLSSIQKHQIEKIRKCGADVRVLYGWQDVKDFIESEVKTLAKV